MKPNARLGWVAVILVGSAVYAILITKDPDIASAIMLGYVGVLLTIFIVNEIWKHNG